MVKVIMIQGTMSNAGKSLVAAGLCRIFKQDGYRVAPFKSQNMALNSFITAEGLEMGRAQVMQAEAASIEPMVCMNPILLKPTNDIGSQVIVNGTAIGNMSARDYFSYKKELIPVIVEAFLKLEKLVDIIVIEGAGSPAEINLKQNDIVNMGMAELVDAPVILVGDIDRGGVFAQLLGTLMLLEKKEKERVKGLVINKFRGDRSILDPGIQMLQEKGKVPVCGVIPYVHVRLEDEDSLTEKFDSKQAALIDLVVIKYPRISNFTDFDVFEKMDNVSVRYVSIISEFHNPDLVFLPGSKNTMGDLKWMRQNGLEAKIQKFAQSHPVIGICGGYQMLGTSVEDPMQVEEGGFLRGMELLPVKTTLLPDKVTRQVHQKFLKLPGFFKQLENCDISGYEIHMGRTQEDTESEITSGDFVYGSYIHGLFDQGENALTLIRILADNKGISYETDQEMDYQQFKESQYDLLADELRNSMDMEYVYQILREASYERKDDCKNDCQNATRIVNTNI